MISLDETLAKVRGVLSAELDHPRVNGLNEIGASKLRRAAVQQHMATIDAELAPIRAALHTLPSLPDEQEIQWAQAISAMNNVRILEVESTGLTEQDEIVRITTIDLTGTVYDDLFFKPSRPMSAEASAANGLTDATLQYAPSLPDLWETIRAVLSGQYVLSFSQQFDRKMLADAAARHHLAPIVFIGDDLQRHCTQYYNGEYYLRLAELCERVGHPLKSTSAIHRAQGQCAILHAMAEGITDVRPPTASILPDDAVLGDIDEHPF